MPFDLPEALVNAGGWVFAAAVLVGVVTGIIRGDLVPGQTHKREIARADQATGQLERMSEFAEKHADQVQALVVHGETILKIVSRVIGNK